MSTVATPDTPPGPSAGTSSAVGWGALARPALRDGLRVVRRDDDHLQLGLDLPDRLVLRDRPGLHQALTHLDRRPPEELRGIVDQLVADGWVVDAACGRQAPDRAPVSLDTDPWLEDSVLRTIASSGLVVGRGADIRLVATYGEPRRWVSDDLVRDDTRHVWLAVLPRAVRIGPFVEPGRTACLRCVDAHLGDRDPRRATVLHQLEELPCAPERDPDHCLVQLGVAWAVRDLVRLLDGRAPALRSATVTITADLELTRTDWLRHPHCGCAWG
jgi:hypothetical protein